MAFAMGQEGQTHFTYAYLYECIHLININCLHMEYTLIPENPPQFGTSKTGDGQGEQKPNRVTVSWSANDVTQGTDHWNLQVLAGRGHSSRGVHRCFMGLATTCDMMDDLCAALFPRRKIACYKKKKKKDFKCLSDG
jgi:hypothetical protein